MTNKIKLIYNWIGPNGPIPNSDIPNIMQLAMQSFNITVDGRYCNSDIIWYHILADKFFEITPSFSLRYLDIKNEIYIYPFSLNWKIPISHDFLIGSGIIESSPIDPLIITGVKYNHGYILIEMNAEAYIANNETFDAMHRYFDALNIPTNKIIFVLGAINIHELYDQWCLNNNIPDENRMKVLFYTHAADGLMMQVIHDPDYIEPYYDINSIPNKLFLSFNRRFRDHRLQLVYKLHESNLIERSYVSLMAADPEYDIDAREMMITRNLLYASEFNKPSFTTFIEKLPLIIDGETDNIIMTCGNENVTSEYYKDSLVSLVTETTYYENHKSLTEKSFKPMRSKHPFIIVGSSGSLKALHSMGFMTFNDFWDESYDTIENGHDRLDQIINICKQIALWNHDQIIEFKKAVKPILEHNYTIISKLTKFKFSADLNKTLISEVQQ